MSTIRPASSCRPPIEPRANRHRPEAPRRPGMPAAPDAPKPAASAPFRALLAAERTEPLPIRVGARPAPLREPSREPERPRPALEPNEPRAEAPLEPFRVMPALLGAPERPTPSPRPLDETALALAGELIEALRVGRVGATGHAVSFRLRRADGAVGVQVVDDGGALRLRLEGGDVASLEALGEQVRAELAARGLELDVELV